MTCLPDAKVCKPSGDKPICPQECLKTKECAAAGLCSLKGTRCVVGTDDDCRQSAACKDEGKCNRVDLGDFGTCVAISPKDCKSSNLCRTKGYCSAWSKTRECRAMSDGDCMDAEVCTINKKCKASKGECIAGKSQEADAGGPSPDPG